MLRGNKMGEKNKNMTSVVNDYFDGNMDNLKVKEEEFGRMLLMCQEKEKMLVQMFGIIKTLDSYEKIYSFIEDEINAIRQTIDNILKQAKENDTEYNILEKHRVVGYIVVPEEALDNVEDEEETDSTGMPLPGEE